MAEYDDDPRSSFMKITRRYCKTFSGSFIPQEIAPGGKGAGMWDPCADVYETESALIVRMEAGGMHKNDFEIKLIEDVLHIRGCRMEREPDCKTRIHQMELNFGPFDKEIRPIPPVDLDRIQATYADGFLTITLTKLNPDKKKIDIG
jgi:HSP20 family molecular chaperone IbpA